MWQTPVPPQVALQLDTLWNFRQSGRCNDGDACILSCFLPELLRPTAGIATYDGVTLQLLRRHLFPPWDHFGRVGGTGHQTHQLGTHSRRCAEMDPMASLGHPSPIAGGQSRTIF
ncbi:hypothetical protein IscW_ISCW014269 [Ixodes scapularis]|uniref:Uncharacterized protein n=1 Tax=Ixodes scapularis TaxID=6945 RepID=B7QI05_IXOSC|nr:hypothetical protein IscW_ISCW014269 [Ixodes scapularis]|eukprot:XP_002414812.1 hypothetical protein IscW_ISCW014269 [Ixodes scapularis]